MSAPETATGGRNWQEMGRLARAACEVQANRQSPYHRQLPGPAELDAQTAHNLWRPAVWVLAAATIVELQAERVELLAEIETLRNDIDDLTFELREAEA